MRTNSFIVIGVLSLCATACGTVAEPAAGGEMRVTASPSAPSGTAPVPDVIGQVDAAIPDQSDQPAFKPVPPTLAPPTPKPVRSPPTPPPDRPASGAVPPENVPTAFAIADLSEILGVAPGSIEVLDARAVTWRDGSVGCPEEGLAYAQAEVPGFLVVLRSGDASYRYHAADNWTPFLCTNPQAPLEGSA